MPPLPVARFLFKSIDTRLNAKAAACGDDAAVLARRRRT